MDGMENLATTEEVSAEVDTTEVDDTQSAETPETAEPGESEDQATAEETAEPEPQIDVNAIAAAARRKAEAEAKATNDEFARRFGNWNNPRTGKPIRSTRDYLDALDAQEEMKAKEQLRQNGIDPNVIDQLVNLNPAVRQAQAIMAQAEQQATINMINADVAELGKMDPSITSLETVPPDVIQMAMQREMSLVDAYKIAMFGKVSDTQQAAIQQAAINQAKGKSHLNPVNGVAVQDSLVEIPQGELGRWKEYFPDKSYEELKKMYNAEL